MRILLNTLYITTENAYLSLEGENVVIWQEKTQLGRVPFHNISGIITFGYGGASPALMGACAKRGIALAFLSRSGRFLAQSTGEPCGNVLLRKEQYRISDSGERSLDYAKSFLIGKIYNARWVIERMARDHSARLDAGWLKKASGFLADAVKRIGYDVRIWTSCGVWKEKRRVFTWRTRRHDIAAKRCVYISLAE